MPRPRRVGSNRQGSNNEGLYLSLRRCMSVTGSALVPRQRPSPMMETVPEACQGVALAVEGVPSASRTSTTWSSVARGSAVGTNRGFRSAAGNQSPYGTFTLLVFQRSRAASRADESSRSLRCISDQLVANSQRLSAQNTCVWRRRTVPSSSKNMIPTPADSHCWTVAPNRLSTTKLPSRGPSTLPTRAPRRMRTVGVGSA